MIGALQYISKWVCVMKMVFCIGGRLGMFPWLCGRRNKQKIIRSSYLNTYETLRDEDSCMDYGMGGMDMSKMCKKHSNCNAKRSNRFERRGVNKDNVESVNSNTYDLHDEHSNICMHPAEDIDELEGASEDVESHSTFRESKCKDNKYQGDMCRNDNCSNNHRAHASSKNAMNASKALRNKKENVFDNKYDVVSEEDVSIKKAEILDKYKARAYMSENRPKSISIESEIDSVCNKAAAINKNSDAFMSSRANKIRTNNRFCEYSPDESESEISFIMDLYDKTSLNNSLKQKMFEYLSLLEKRSKEELHRNTEQDIPYQAFTRE
ncbi:hypothetical protein HK407_02g03590 [Ordospora pajunii]|uniref:uncharacterized protein n=1 Tax=Ordospora pajunii TaxID=3039483 RepID=UPI0029526A57|nr:uncharacterized protein HK407_02g03590 [Ordospora pajunii]KAH9411914.1 hypothetical protein HK407_02g03590 [Ordospora pajunii]